MRADTTATSDRARPPITPPGGLAMNGALISAAGRGHGDCRTHHAAKPILHFDRTFGTVRSSATCLGAAGYTLPDANHAVDRAAFDIA